jgi:thioesterase domain-containing protein
MRRFIGAAEALGRVTTIVAPASGSGGWTWRRRAVMRRILATSLRRAPALPDLSAGRAIDHNVVRMNTHAPPTAEPRASTALLDRTLQKIPLTETMRVEIRAYDGQSLTLSAPLAPNVNDKGCAFGGSIASLLTLAGWGLILLRLETERIDCDIYVQDSTIRYLAPLWGDLRAYAEIASDGPTWDEFLAALAACGRARLHVNCSTPTEAGADACTLVARFVAIVRDRTSTR